MFPLSTLSWRTALALTAITVLAALPSIAEGTSEASLASPNPAAPGFLAAESDAEAIELADRVMARMGGRKAWDTTRFVTWKFFGNRFHVWDRHTGDIRVEGVDRESKEPYVVLMNLHSKQGRAWKAGNEVTEPDSLTVLLEGAESAWINDSYWMFMPYKLKDTGVVLEYLGERKLLDGRPAQALGLTFREVGRTPENRYVVYVADSSGLVEQWDFFTKATDESPRFQVPWRNWRRHGSILLSDDRGRGQHSGIDVFESVPSETFTSPEPTDFSALSPAPTTDLAEAPIYSVEGDVTPPEIQNSVAPEYPDAAKEAGTTGLVVVRTVIGKDGSIRDAWVTKSPGEAFDQAALEAIRQWQFTAAEFDGLPVEVYYNLTINFQLDGDDDDAHFDGNGEGEGGGEDGGGAE